MLLFHDCIPCFIRQSLDSVRLVTSDERLHEQVLRTALQTAAEMDLQQTPPEMAQQIHRAIRTITNRDDPYREIKDRFNAMALKLYPTLQEWIDASDRPMDTTVRLAIAGNVIDFGVKSQLTVAEVRQAIMHSLSVRLEGDLSTFLSAVKRSRRILYLADNAGEIVFDRLLIERLPRGKVTVAVRGRPVINDATRADAETAGIPAVAEVIDNGSDAPGTLLNDCSTAFRERFDQADLVIAKGQGNFETLSDVTKDVFFLLKAKCSVIARHLDCSVGSLVLRRSKASPCAGGCSP